MRVSTTCLFPLHIRRNANCGNEIFCRSFRELQPLLSFSIDARAAAAAVAEVDLVLLTDPICAHFVLLCKKTGRQYRTEYDLHLKLLVINVFVFLTFPLLSHLLFYPELGNYALIMH